MDGDPRSFRSTYVQPNITIRQAAASSQSNVGIRASAENLVH